MDVDLVDQIVYVRTDVGCWKIVYKISRQKFILLHRNYVEGRISLEEVENASYHRQTDMSEAGTIIRYLKYIQKHDEFKQNMPADYHKMPQDSRRQKAYYRAEQKRAERKSARRLDSLFALIEHSWGESSFISEPMARNLSLTEECCLAAGSYDIDIEPDDIDVIDMVTVVWRIGA